MARLISVVFLLGLTCLTSCDRNRLFEKYKSVEDHEWFYQDTMKYQVEVRDTTGLYHLYVNMRNKANYPYRNIWLNIAKIAPDGATTAYKKEFKLADKKGKWKGQGLGDVYDHRFPTRKKLKFEQAGEYEFRVNHLMRRDTLPGIMDVGVRVEKVR